MHEEVQITKAKKQFQSWTEAVFSLRQNSDLCSGVQVWFFRTIADRKLRSIMFDEISKSRK